MLPAYVIGMVLAGTVGKDHILVRRLRTLTFGLLTPFYFIRAGSLVSVSALVSAPLIFLALFAAKMFSKMIPLVPTVRTFNYLEHEGMYYSRKGQTALLWAAAEGHKDVVRLLIEKGANIQTASKAGFNALMFAATKNDAASVKALLAAGANPNYALADGTKVLMAAASHRGTAAALALLDGGADPKISDRAGNTLLHTAAQTGEVELVRKLIAKGVDIEARTPNSAGGGGRGGGFCAAAGAQTPLLVAARAGQIEAMRALLEAGADPKAKAQDGSSFLMAAVGSARVDAVKFAYRYDLDIKIVTASGATLMHASVTGTANGATQESQERICEVIRFLAEKGAPLDEKNAAGRTPIDLADGLPIDKAVDLFTELILKSGAKPKSPSKR